MGQVPLFMWSGFEDEPSITVDDKLKGKKEPTVPAFEALSTHYYSNSKYLADFNHGVSVNTCKEYCSTWKDTCKEKCNDEKACQLSDDVNADHYSRDESCDKECAGFNMH